MASDYDDAGVRRLGTEGGLAPLAATIAETFAFNEARPLLPLGYFANVVPLSPEIGIAVATDGVGTKLLVAQALGRYDTVGIDCVAMNSNDILCVGARPVTLVDYIAVEDADPQRLAEIAKGFVEGARQSHVSIPGGEVAQVRELLHRTPDGSSFDLVATCIGTVHPAKMIIGEGVRPGDVVIGLASSGIHSNGLTLARSVLMTDDCDLLAIDPELGTSIGDALLEPTRIYVDAALAWFDAELDARSLSHITGDGFLNLARTKTPVGFVLDALPEPQPVFRAIQSRGDVDDAEMHRVFNMGIGFCGVFPPEEAEHAISLARKAGYEASAIGHVCEDERRRVFIPGRGLVGEGENFRQAEAGEMP